ncbi:MAG TPA: hypothetical protein VFD43_08440, partial [Planctomycetota bacterium]|nr:hypothetical protein [Planctomycetota bacterium]
MLDTPLLRTAAAAALLLALCALPLSCGYESRAPRPGELLILDADAGPAIEGGERRGVLFKVPLRQDGSYGAPQIYARDERWIEPVDVLALANGDALVLEQQWSSEPAPALGAVFLVRAPRSSQDPLAQASVQLLLADPRMR